MANWIIKCDEQSDYKKVRKAFQEQDIPIKVKYKDDDIKKGIKHIKVSKNVVDFADTIYFTLQDENIDFTLYEKEKGFPKEEVMSYNSEEMMER